MDFTVAIGDVHTVGGNSAVGSSHRRAIRISDLELHAGKRLFAEGIQLADNQVSGPLIPEGKGGGFAGLDLGGLGLAVRDTMLKIPM